MLFCCLFFAFFSTKWNLECEWHVHTGASCSGMFLTFRSDRAEGNTYGESNQGWCLNKRRITLSVECHRRNVWSDLTMGLTDFFSRDFQEIVAKFHVNLLSHCMRQILLDLLLRFLRLNAYCSFVKSCGGSDTFKRLQLTFQLFFESLDDEGWNIEKESLFPCDLWGWAVATTVKIVEGFCDHGELLRNLIIEGADTGLFFIAPINSVTLDNSHDADFDKRRRLQTFGFSRVSSIEESRSFNLTTWLGPTFVLADGRFLMH